MKILYAAQNNKNALIQLSRFLQAMQSSSHQIKVAAYKQSSPKLLSVDWTLDCLLNLYKPKWMNLDNDNLKTYFEQIKYYAPDLIISDLEYFSSYIAQILNIEVWQCSSSVINFALTQNTKFHVGTNKFYAYLLNPDHKYGKFINLLDNANKKFVYSHFGDTASPPSLSPGFEWIRPYHQVGKDAIPCQHNLVAGLSFSHKQILNLMKKITDSVAFIDSVLEIYPNPKIKDIRNQEEYFCNLKNSPLFLCQGQTSFLADAFYNGKYSLIYPDYQDAESVLNSCISQYLELGQIIDLTYDFGDNHRAVLPSYNNIKYLHERIEELCF